MPLLCFVSAWVETGLTGRSEDLCGGGGFSWSVPIHGNQSVRQDFVMSFGECIQRFPGENRAEGRYKFKDWVIFSASRSSSHNVAAWHKICYDHPFVILLEL